MRAWRTLLVAISVCAWAGGVLADYREEPVENGGTIAGSVVVAGDVPVLPPQPVYKERPVCGRSMPDQRLMVGKGGKLKNAVVALVDVAAGRPVPRDQPVVLDNVRCAFVPHVRGATVGQTLEIHNSDPFLHDAHAWLGTRTLFNVGILPGHTARQPLNAAGVIHINCNVRHTWMHAYVFVGTDPYHAVTGDDGTYVIDQVPPGTYRLRVWHELLGSRERAIDVWKLDHLIHEFHQGPRRELWKRYADAASMTSAVVAHAIATGILDRSTVPREVLDHLAAAIEMFERD